MFALIVDQVIVEVFASNPNYPPELEVLEIAGVVGDYVVGGVNIGQPATDFDEIVGGVWVTNTAAQAESVEYEAQRLAEQQALSSLAVSGGSITQQFSGRFLLDPNEVNGFGQGGFTDETLSRDLGNADAASLSRLGGGFMFPHDVNLKSFKAWHRNSNNAAQAWGWVIAVLSKTDASNTQVTTYVVHETQENSNVGTRDYLNTQTQLTELDLSTLPNNAVSAGDVICIGVAAPTANTTNYYVEVMSGYVEVEPV